MLDPLKVKQEKLDPLKVKQEMLDHPKGQVKQVLRPPKKWRNSGLWRVPGGPWSEVSLHTDLKGNSSASKKASKERPLIRVTFITGPTAV